MLRLGALALAIGGAYDVGASQGFERGAVTVPGLIPQGGGQPLAHCVYTRNPR
jgi:hypothetical protein